MTLTAHRLAALLFWPTVAFVPSPSFSFDLNSWASACGRLLGQARRLETLQPYSGIDVRRLVDLGLRVVRIGPEASPPLGAEDLWLRAETETSNLSRLVRSLWSSHQVAVVHGASPGPSAAILTDRPDLPTPRVQLVDLRALDERDLEKILSELSNRLDSGWEFDRIVTDQQFERSRTAILATTASRTMKVQRLVGAGRFRRKLAIGEPDMLLLQTQLLLHPDMTGPDFLSAAFEVYFRARTRQVSPSQQKRIRRILANITDRTLTDVMGRPAGGTFWPSTDEIGISDQVPRGSLEYYLLLVHELEHALQDVSRISEFWWILTHSPFGDRQTMIVKWLYTQELGAIRAEFDFFRLIPAGVHLPGVLAARPRGNHYDQWLRARSGNFAAFHRYSRYPNEDVVRISRCLP